VGADFALPAGSDDVAGAGFGLTSPVTDFESSGTARTRSV
jgi:hypothetical protein